MKVTDLVFEALETFGFLIQRNEQLLMTAFAERIERAYDATAPRTAAVCKALRSCR